MAVTQIRGDKQIKAATVTETELNTSVAGDGITGGGGAALAVNDDDSTLTIVTDVLKVKDAGITGTQLNTSVAGDGLVGGGGAALSVNDDDSTLTIVTDVLKVKDGGITGTQLNASVAGDGLAGGGGSALSVNVDATTIEISTDTLRVKANGIDTNELAADAVTGAEIADDAVNSEHIASGAVDVDHLSDLRVTEGTALVADFAAGTLRNDNTIVSVAAGTTTVADGDVSFVEVDAAGSVTNNTVGFTSGRVPLAEVTAVAGDITVVTDKRAWLDVEIGASGLTNSDFVDREDVAFDFDGVDATGVLANTPLVGSEHVYSNGILQNEGASDDYQISGATITFNAGSEPESGDEVLVSYRK